MSQPRVSVVMRTKNSDWVVAQALSGLFSQEFDDFQLVVVDSGSTDRTLQIVSEYPCKLLHVAATSYFPGSVLNMAMEQADGDIVVFQNSDVVPLNKFALGRLVGAFDDDNISAAYARQVPRPEAWGFVRRDYDVSFPAEDSSPSWITLSLPFAAMRKSAWEERQFYTDAWASEDTEWGKWASENGRLIKYVHDAVVMHSHNYTLRQLYGRRFVEGEADAFIYESGDSFVNMMTRLARSTGSDWKYQLKHGLLREACSTPVRRFVYQWAYRKGRCLGHQRREQDHVDSSVGQRVALERHEQ
jgi:rhamnosyltransferase